MMQRKKKAKTTLLSSNLTLERSVLPSHASKQLLIDADNVQVSHGIETVLADVSLCIHSGEFVGLVGPNGAGKTTLLKVLLGLLRPQQGTVTRAKHMVVGYIPQRGSQAIPQVPVSVLEVVLLGAKGDTAAANAALADVKMADVAHKRFTELSGGQQQRVAIAKALAAKPDVLILDEPTTGIDEHSQTAFYDILSRLQQQGITIIMVSHDVDTVLRLVTRVICINGSIVYDGVPEHFEADKYLPDAYKQQHMLLHHHHGGPHDGPGAGADHV
jgi:zinc transport system ATP-binding protein